jgi:hypothetical protein
MNKKRLHGPVFEAVYIPIKKDHPAFYKLEDCSEKMISAEEWKEACESEGIDPLLPEEVTDVIIAKKWG